MKWLQDKVCSIRDAAANNLKWLAEEFCSDWAMQHIIPQVIEMTNDPHYLYRMTILCVISLLAPVMGSEIACSKLLPVVINCSKDRVPNIKFNVAKVLQSLITFVGHPVVVKMIGPCLVELSEDPDADVCVFSPTRHSKMLTISRCQARLRSSIYVGNPTQDGEGCQSTFPAARLDAISTKFRPCSSKTYIFHNLCLEDGRIQERYRGSHVDLNGPTSIHACAFRSIDVDNRLQSFLT